MNDTVSLQVWLHQTLGALLLPPFLYLLPLLLGLALLARRPWLGRSLIAAAVLGTWLLSLPVTAMWLNGWLERYPPLRLADLRQAQAIVVLGAGKRPAPEYAANVLSGGAAVRLHYAVWLHRQSGLPLLLTGGAPLGGESEAAVMARTLRQDYGITARWLEGSSRTTLENARNSAVLLRRDKVGRIALVTHGWHMPRALPFFTRQGLTVLPAPTGHVRYDGPPASHWLPQGGAQQECYQALRELVGIAFYAVRQVLPGAA